MKKLTLVRLIASQPYEVSFSANNPSSEDFALKILERHRAQAESIIRKYNLKAEKAEQVLIAYDQIARDLIEVIRQNAALKTPQK